MYKDCFKLMDINKDGQLDKNDLRGAFDNVGVLMSESELDGLLGEISGPCTYDNMVKMFQEKMAGGGCAICYLSIIMHHIKLTSHAWDLGRKAVSQCFLSMHPQSHRQKKIFCFPIIK